MTALYIGTKVVRASSMTRLEYNKLRGWTVQADENPQDKGYLLEYTDGGKPNVKGFAGYVSWSPAAQFDAAYRPFDGLTFGQALEAMKRGAKVTRDGWNGAGMWVCIGEGRLELPTEAFWNEHTREHAAANGGVASVRSYFILKTAQNDIMMGWAPSASDALAEDWEVLVDGVPFYLTQP